MSIGNDPLIRPKDEKEQHEDKQIEWKNRLKTWKEVRKSKNIMKSPKDAFQDLSLSLTQSVLLVLQSPVSIRKLSKKVEGAYIRAVCRTIGLNALRKLL